MDSILSGSNTSILGTTNYKEMCAYNVSSSWWYGALIIIVKMLYMKISVLTSTRVCSMNY